MKETKLSWHHIECLTQEILRQMQQDQWHPDYVVGLTRGGLTPAVLISQYLGIPMYALKISLRDSVDDSESNLWMAEEAFGYVSQDEQATIGSRWDPSHRKRILIVDDINDSGATLEWLKQDWQSNCLPNEISVWNTVWNRNVKFAVLVDNKTSSFKTVDYFAHSVNKLDDPQWIVFPWEQFWLQ